MMLNLRDKCTREVIIQFIIFEDKKFDVLKCPQLYKKVFWVESMVFVLKEFHLLRKRVVLDKEFEYFAILYC
jgi:IS4 transposase